jgi:glucan-binding YG repeat protein
MTGWQYLYGADGKNVTHDMYYLNSDCQVTTGVKKIGSHYYYFSAGGQMNYGTYSSKGSYSGWKKYSDGKRYFKLSSSKKYAYMCRGLTSIKGRYYYFDEQGFKLVDESIEEVGIVKIGSYYYAMDYDGELTVKDMELIDGHYYYFNSKGHMVHNTECKVGGKYYLFDENGAMIVGENGTELYEFNNKTYAVREDGSLVTGKRGKIHGDTYYFNKKGVVQKNKIVKIGKNKYYFDKDGKMVTDSSFKLNGKKYKADEDGVVTGVKSK